MLNFKDADPVLVKALFAAIMAWMIAMTLYICDLYNTIGRIDHDMTHISLGQGVRNCPVSQ